MILGIIFAVISGVLWGLIFIGPLLVPEYPSTLQASGRYVAFGLISLLISWYDRKSLQKLTLEDWIEAVKLVLTGNLIYYTCLASAIQRIGAPISTAIIGTLPVVITITGYIISQNQQESVRKISHFALLTSLCCIIIGLFCINIAELKYEHSICNIEQYFFGIIFAVIAVICWAWYALKNANWLHTHPNNNAMTWANAQGIVIFPISCILYCCCIYIHANFIQDEFTLPFGPRPIFFITLMSIIGLCCSWLGTFFWNEASKRLPIMLIGPMIVFETIFGLIYAFVYRKLWPSLLIIFGICFLILGVISSMKIHKYY